MMWDIKKAQQSVRIIQKAIRKKWGYNVCVYGSVLYKGRSDSDLDLQLIPAGIKDDKYAEASKVAEDVALSLGGQVTQSMTLKAIGEMCFIIEFFEKEEFRRIDMVIRRTVLYIPADEEIMKAASVIIEKRELLKRCEIA